MTTNTDALLPCPFCGGEASHHVWGGGTYMVCCVNDDCRGGVRNRYANRNEESAIAAWNTRTPAPSVTSEELAAKVRTIAEHYGAGLAGAIARDAAQAILTAFHVSRKE